ncbi:DegT/DnrJ/EryC1/StrS family aminotransferase [Saccharothrix hoggarensis]|uniref:DegT/DnrJ/EryC1/StrS family aminotransferase n=1 Tax=Saccharothrix hoggarensis TaxID=913853 RepID=A0ABW3QR76_9PSEU
MRKYGYRPDDYPHAHRVGQRLLSLPLTPGMDETDVRQVINAVRRVVGRHAPC